MRLVEILVAANALAGILGFFGVRFAVKRIWGRGKTALRLGDDEVDPPRLGPGDLGAPE